MAKLGCFLKISEQQQNIEHIHEFISFHKHTLCDNRGLWNHSWILLMHLSLLYLPPPVKESSDGPHFRLLPGDKRASSGSDWGCQEREWEGGEGVCPGLPWARQQTGGGKTLINCSCMVFYLWPNLPSASDGSRIPCFPCPLGFAAAKRNTLHEIICI